MQLAGPGFNDKVYPPHKIAALAFALSEIGIDPADVLAGTGITPERLQSPDTRVSYRQTQQAFLNALRLTPDASRCAFRAGERMRVTAYGMYGYALLSSRSHQESLQFALKYHRVMGPVADMTYDEDGNDAIFVYTPLLCDSPDDDLYRLTMEFQFASHVTINQDLYGSSFRLSGVRVRYAAPEHARDYERVFGCPVRFSQERNELRFDRRWMTEPMRYANPITNAMALEMCERGLAEVRKAGTIAAEVYRVLFEQPGRFPNIDAIAGELKTNARALRRRLAAEQMSYRDILAEVRMRLAIEYLRNTDMTNDEIATRLGYSEAANFRHAFIRWTQHNPSYYRKP
ncbi:AraC family transcriptional regulator [Burkholderia guangdongensis]|uniref:AraC family transcriptional regulator n=1 Tax=Burkholderia guangdongensis TaxID=1792500 RepID=UPI0015CD9F1B|nr:AraC family transcriptional regulator [Burkholderia guangdongensis]